MTARARSPRAQRTYSITFPEGQEPPVNGFWSLTLYNDKHLFHPNDPEALLARHQKQETEAQ